MPFADPPGIIEKRNKRALSNKFDIWSSPFTFESWVMTIRNIDIFFVAGIFWAFNSLENKEWKWLFSSFYNFYKKKAKSILYPSWNLFSDFTNLSSLAASLISAIIFAMASSLSLIRSISLRRRFPLFSALKIKVKLQKIVQKFKLFLLTFSALT